MDKNDNDNLIDDEILESDDRVQGIKDSMLSGNLIEKTVEEIMSSSMLPYSEHVIMDRALPRVEDGLKPVQRRVLYDMLELGLTPDKAYKKCARVVGDTLGKYHPHGDSSVYGSLARMAQNFVMGECLVDGYGNFGSIDGDDPAAMRYTECRLTPLALELMKDIEKETVTHSYNFDDTLKEPDYFPGRFPNLLVNGATGIAVGLATNIPTHNLGEVIDGVVAYIDNPNIKLNQMLKLIKGPDFPTGGEVCASKDMHDAYETGRGKATMRAVFNIEEDKNGKQNIVITELPYQVNKAELLVSIGNLKEKLKDELADVVDITDESDKSGMRAVISVKKDGNIDNIIALLFKHTNMQLNFNYNMVAIANGSPRQLGLLNILSYYVNFQVDIIVRRTKFDHDKAVARAHIIEGLCIAIANIDEVIRIIKKSSSAIDAKTKLMESFLLTEIQTQAILDMRLARLTSLETEKLQQELAELRRLIEEYKSILESKSKQLSVVKKEILEIKRKYATPRKTKIVTKFDEYEAVKFEKKIADIECTITVTNDALSLKRLDNKQLINASASFDYSNMHPVNKFITHTSTASNIWIFTNFGNFFRIQVQDIPVAKITTKGTPLAQISNAEIKEKIVAVFDENEISNTNELLMFTTDGYIKRVETSEYKDLKSGSMALKLKDFDRLVSVQINDNLPSTLMVSTDGMAVNVECETVPVTKRLSGGVIGMILNDGCKIIFASQVNTLDRALVITEDACGKKFSLNELPITARNRKGLRILTSKEKILIVISPIVTGDIVMQDAKSNIHSIEVNNIPIESRANSCKPLVKNTKFEIREVGLYLS